MAVLASQTTNDDSAFLGGIPAQTRQAQEFILTTAAEITEVDVYFNANYNSPTGQVTIRIETDSSGLPSGNLVNANATKAVTVTASAENAFVFATAFNIEANTKYHIVWQCDNQTDAAWRVANNSAGGYAGGDGEQSSDGGSTWASAGGRDNWFELIGTVIPSNYQKEFTETVTPSEVYTKSITHSFIDTMTPTEVIVKSPARSFSEVMTPSEVSMIRGLGKLLIDTMTPTDTYARNWTLLRTYSDTATPTDTVTKGLSRAWSEVMTITDSVRKATARAFLEVSTVTDSITRAITRALSETVTLTEVAAKSVSVFLEEVMTITDSITKQWVFARTFTETITISEAFTKALKWLRETFNTSVWNKATRSTTSWTSASKSTTSWTKKYG